MHKQLVEYAFASAHLPFKQVQAVLPLGQRGCVMLQLADDDQHSRQGRTHVMRCTGCLHAQLNDALVAQGVLAHACQGFIALPDYLRHTHHKIGYDNCADHKPKPHADDVYAENIIGRHHMMHVLVFGHGHGQWHIKFHQQAIACSRKGGHCPGIAVR